MGPSASTRKARGLNAVARQARRPSAAAKQGIWNFLGSVRPLKSVLGPKIGRIWSRGVPLIFIRILMNSHIFDTQGGEGSLQILYQKFSHLFTSLECNTLQLFTFCRHCIIIVYILHFFLFLGVIPGFFRFYNYRLDANRQFFPISLNLNCRL